MNIAHVALWTRNLDAQVQFWETVFNGRSNARYVSKNRPGFESHFITLGDGPTIELMTVPELPDAPAHPEFIGHGGQHGGDGTGKRHAAQRAAHDGRRIL